MNPRYSVIIPTYNHCEDLLKPCLESIIKYTDLSNVEVIVVANGCVDNTREYVESLGEPFKLIWIDEAAGYTRATNVGIKAATGTYVVLLNNDTVLLPQSTNHWLNMLEAPFEKQSMGLTGPLQLHDDYANAPVLIFFCVMIKRTVFETIGYLDEIFSPGGGEDIDFTVRARQAGYDAEVLEPTKFAGGTNVASFPIWHKNNQTFINIPEYTNYIVKRNGLINCKRYNKDIKLNLGAGGIEYPGYLSVDFYDKRANILMDIQDLDFPDNSVTEILASHVFEHLNPYSVFKTLQNWNRVLKPGGKLVMEMPNIEELCRRFVTANKAQRYGILNAVYGSVNTTNVGTPDQITSPHLFGWWPEALWDHLVGTGYVDIQFMSEKIPHPESNFRVECYKPIGVAISPVKIDHAKYAAQEPLTYQEIFTDNAYRLTEDEIRGKVVVDVGANLGFFTLFCLELGARKVIAVEAVPIICSQGLSPNTQDFPVKVINAAVLDVDDKIINILNEHVASRIRSGTDGDAVKTITLKTLIKDLTDSDMVLKLDCEGSEFEILLNGERDVIRRFEYINMELHNNTNENPAFQDVQLVRDRLVELGYERVSQVAALRDNCAIEKWKRHA